MKKFNVSTEAVGKIAKKGCSFVVFTLAMVMPYVSVKDLKRAMRNIGNVKYNDVIEEIMDSGMLPSDKSKTVDLVPKDGDLETYRAIIHVVNSSMLPSDKVKTVESICEK